LNALTLERNNAKPQQYHHKHRKHNLVWQCLVWEQSNQLRQQVHRQWNRYYLN
jgi:hypothetical protein